METIEQSIERYQKNFEVLFEADIQAKAKETLVGRYISHPIADGRAYYQITKTTKHWATIEVVTGIGDDWVLPAWGEEAKIPIKTARQFIAEREAIEKLFGKKRAIRITASD